MKLIPTLAILFSVATMWSMTVVHATARTLAPSLNPWTTSNEWRSFDEDVADYSPEVSQGWAQSAQVVSAVVHLPVTSEQLRAFWTDNPSTSSPVDSLAFTGTTIEGRDRSGRVLFADRYRYVTTRLHGIENGPTEIFRAAHPRGQYTYIALMEPEAGVNKAGQAMARHFHFRYGASDSVVTENDHGYRYLTMVDHAATPAERARTIVAFHQALPKMIQFIKRQLVEHIR